MKGLRFGMILFCLLEALQAKPIVSITGFGPSSYEAGTTLTVTATAFATNGNILGDTAFTWFALYHHDDHYHDGPAFATNTSTAMYTVPVSFDLSAQVSHEIYVVVRDSTNETDTARVNVPALLSYFKVVSYPDTVNVTLTFGSFRTPSSVVGLRNVQWSALVPQQYSKRNTLYIFKTWNRNYTNTGFTFTTGTVQQNFRVDYVDTGSIYADLVLPSYEITSAGSTLNATITSNYFWKIDNTSDWIILSVTSGLDTLNTSISFTENTSVNDRQAVITLSARNFKSTVTLLQKGITTISGNTSSISESVQVLPELFPNPASEAFKLINYSENVSELQVIDIIGRPYLLYGTMNQFDTSSLPKGIYVVKIPGEKTSFNTTKRLIIQ